ncbi:MAG: FMN-binding protein [Candidatus Omnitrophica bacterium]|nr:FMN-binding protein [Candidatus Omnitrophota bacterium]
MRRTFSIFITVFITAISILSYAENYLSKDDFLKKILSSSEKIETKEIKLSEDKKKIIEKRFRYRIPEDSFTFYIGKTKEKTDVYCLVLRERGKHGPITFIFAITQDGTIKDMAVLESKEVKGSKIGKRRFLRQFIGKSFEDPLRLKKDIDAVTGATISSNAATRAARKALMIWQEMILTEGRGG